MPSNKNDRKRPRSEDTSSPATVRDKKMSRIHSEPPTSLKKDSSPASTAVSFDFYEKDSPKIKFEKLPAELRTMIFSNALNIQNWIDVGSVPAYFMGPTLYPTMTGMFLTSKTISEEAQEVFYSGNKFSFALQVAIWGKPLSITRLGNMRNFIKTIGSTNANAIRKVRIDWPNIRHPGNAPHFVFTGDQELIDLLKTNCPNLQTLALSRTGLTNLLFSIWIDRTNEPSNQALRFLDSQIRAIVSVREIVVEGYASDHPVNVIQPLWSRRAGILMDKLREMGWKIITS